jgi:hypothetical protein
MRKDKEVSTESKPKKQVIKHYKNPNITVAARTEKALVENEYKMVTLKNLEKYVDKDGNVSTGVKGIAVQTQIRIKRHFDEAREDFTEGMFDLLIALYRSLNRQINDSIRKQQLTRPEIKQKIWDTIEKYGELARTEK